MTADADAALSRARDARAWVLDVCLDYFACHDPFEHDTDVQPLPKGSNTSASERRVHTKPCRKKREKLACVCALASRREKKEPTVLFLSRVAGGAETVAEAQAAVRTLARALVAARTRPASFETRRLSIARAFSVSRTAPTPSLLREKKRSDAWIAMHLLLRHIGKEKMSQKASAGCRLRRS